MVIIVPAPIVGELVEVMAVVGIIVTVLIHPNNCMCYYFIVGKREELLEYSFQLTLARASGVYPQLLYVKAFQFTGNCTYTGRNKGEIKMESYNVSSSCSILDSPQLCFSFFPTTGVRGFVVFLMLFL